MTLLRRALWALLWVGVLGSGGLMCSRVAERGRYVGAFSSHGAGPEGARALYLLSERLNAAPVRWTQDLASLPDGGGMLVALGDCGTGMARPLSRYERQELRRWIDAGGTLLVAGARYYLPDGLGVSFALDARCRQTISLLGLGESSESGKEGDSKDSPADAEGTDGDAVQEGVDDGAHPEDDELPHEGADEAPFSPDPEVVEGEADDRAVDPVDGSELDGVLPEEWFGQWTTTHGPLAGIGGVPLLDPGTIELDPEVEHEVILRTGRLDALPEDAPDAGMGTVDASAMEVTEAAEADASGDAPTSIAGVVVHHGAGRVVVLASASPLQNRAVLASDGGVLFARLLDAFAPRGPVIFDEYHLGVGERRSMMRYLMQSGAGPVALQLLWVVGILLLRAGTRFGGVRETVEEAPAGTVSYVSAMGHLFERSDDDSGALAILVREALARIARHHHMPIATAQRLARSLEQRNLGHAAAAVRAIEALQRDAEDRDARLPASSARLDALVERACRGPEPHAASMPTRAGRAGALG